MLDGVPPRGHNAYMLKQTEHEMQLIDDYELVRPLTCRVLDMMDSGGLDARQVAEMCLRSMSEDDIKLVLQANDISTEDDDYDGQPDEAQEWNDFDPDC